ncbi:lytic transglycosylase domain-containing protein [Methylocystis echinoides]|uniref:Lytic transglycosylase n=1 Tax=Methylocystis echinoides TaxID=29468 RepID=A0A9W6LTG7_9HYPH|nr:lytic transglycosylase domain-containing protein [Methylocystis echinoides]GLI94476.1 lytic transglycosylase [Methylocystis echinoides]
MKSTACAVILATLGLAGCAANESPVASAPESYVNEPRSDERISTHMGSHAGKEALHARIAHFARLYDIPESLIHRSVRRESNYNPGARNGPYWGLMQIRHDTAKGMGYSGPAHGLLDADTNLTYAVPYLANAYKLSGGNESRAIQLYAGGYYYEAKRRGMLSLLHKEALQPE